MGRNPDFQGVIFMLVEDIEWKEEYGIGVEQIDDEHKQLFKIAKRLFMLSKEKTRGQWAAEESIKFLKSYCIKHFEHEEAYMRSIGYKDLETHQKHHTHMREVIVPRIESHLRYNKFSPEAMEKFLDIVRLWLTRHILEHDKAIGWQRASVASI